MKIENRRNEGCRDENSVRSKNIEKVYDTGGNKFAALKGINLQVKEGEFVGIMGPSGSGKTTLLNVLSTIDNATNGEILIDGKDIVKMNDDKLALFRHHLGFIFQDYNLLDTLTVKENIALPLALSKVKASEIDRRVLEISKKFGIDHILSQFPYQVSGGQKRQQRSRNCYESKYDFRRRANWST